MASKDKVRIDKDGEIENEEILKRARARTWARAGEDVFQLAGSPDVTKKLTPGFYEIGSSMQGLFFVRRDLCNDEIIKFNTGVVKQVSDEIEEFQKREKIFKDMGFLHRRGYILYGPPGSGKTICAKSIIDASVQRIGAVAFSGNNISMLSNGLKEFREVEPNRFIICLFEDIDAILRNNNEAFVLSMLDGEDQVDHVLNIATTNYPERLDRRIVARPRRFDRVIKISHPEPIIREAFLKRKLKHVPDKTLKIWVKESEGLSFSAMTELIVSVVCLGIPLPKAAKILRDMNRGGASSAEWGTGEEE